MAEDKNGNHHVTGKSASLQAQSSSVTAVVTIVQQLVAAGVPKEYALKLPEAIEEDRKTGMPTLKQGMVAMWITGLNLYAIKGVGEGFQHEITTIIQHAIDLLR